MVARASVELLGAMQGDRARAAVMPWPEIVSTVRRQMGSLLGPGHRDFEDLTQAALERVVVALPRFEGRAQLTTFTYSICAHVAMSHWRGWRRWARRFQFWTDRVFDEPSPDDVGKAWIEAERARRLHACIERLSPMKRTCVTLADLEELPAGRIAEILGCPEPTVRSRLRAGRAELTSMLRRDPLFAVALGVLAWLALTGVDRRPGPVATPAEDAATFAPVIPDVAPAPLVVAEWCAACSRPLARGDRLAPGEHVQVPVGEALVLCFALGEASQPPIDGPAEVVVETSGPVVRAASIEGKLAPMAPLPSSALAIVSPAVAPADVDPLGEWRASQDALRSGDRAAAERHLRAMVGLRHASSNLRARGSFALAELELARGATSDARARLEPLVATADASLGADAVFLLARLAPSAQERAAIYATYLACAPPSPYREQAMVARAQACLAAGDSATARHLASAVRAEPHVPDVVAASLASLERQL